MSIVYRNGATIKDVIKVYRKNNQLDDVCHRVIAVDENKKEIFAKEVNFKIEYSCPQCIFEKPKSYFNVKFYKNYADKSCILFHIDKNNIIPKDRGPGVPQRFYLPLKKVTKIQMDRLNKYYGYDKKKVETALSNIKCENYQLRAYPSC